MPPLRDRRTLYEIQPNKLQMASRERGNADGDEQPAKMQPRKGDTAPPVRSKKKPTNFTPNTSPMETGCATSETLPNKTHKLAEKERLH